MSNIITAGNATNNGTSISSDTSGVLELRTGSTPTTALTIGTNQVVTVVNPIQGGTITSGTAVATTSGTSIDFTGIPSWVKRITVMLSGVSTNGSSSYLVRLGTSSGIVSTGYVSSGSQLNPSSGSASSTTGIIVVVDSSGYICNGNISICKLTSNTWVASYSLGLTGVATGTAIGGGSVDLGATLDRVRITTVNGTDTFDAGSINILYE
jgi:hypothetical protein